MASTFLTDEVTHTRRLANWEALASENSEGAGGGSLLTRDAFSCARTAAALFIRKRRENQHTLIRTRCRSAPAAGYKCRKFTESDGLTGRRAEAKGWATRLTLKGWKGGGGVTEDISELSLDVRSPFVPPQSPTSLRSAPRREGATEETLRSLP